MIVSLEYGDGRRDVEVPDGSAVVSPQYMTHEPAPLPDPVAATSDALDNPVGGGRIEDLVGPGSTVTIAFPDRVKGGAHATAHRRVALQLILERLRRAGVRDEHVHLLCAIGLHRKNRPDEIRAYLGGVYDDVIDRTTNHDAEDPAGTVELPESSEGDVVAANRRLLESDLSILLGHATGNPYGGYSGGYKMPATGLTTWRSIAGHHTPGTLLRDDFVPANTHSHFRDQLRAIGQRIEEAMPRPFFAVDAVLDSANRQLCVAAGTIPEVEQATWALAGRRTEVTLDIDPADVLLVGVPRNFHYGPGMGTNPILMMQSLGASMVRAKAALVERPWVVGVARCDGWFNDRDFPSYHATYDLLQHCHRPGEMKRYEEEVCTDHEWIFRYREQYAYHPFHAFSMIYMGALLLHHVGGVYIAGAKEPGFARGMGARTTATPEDALAEIGRNLGREPRVLVVPSLTEPAFHVRAGGAA
jgi:lactate racemase